MKLWVLIAIGLTVAACGPNAVQRDNLAATQAVVDERVKAGQMTDAEGRLAMAKARADIDAEIKRNYAIAVSGGDGPATYQRVGPGTVVRY
jgi:hypothetical protein